MHGANTMRLVRRLFLVSLVCLTAGATLLAGTPQLICGCPGDKAGTPVVNAPAARCPCHGGCCTLPESTDSPSCCSAARESRPASPLGTAQTIRHCIRTVSQPGWLSLSPTKPTTQSAELRGELVLFLPASGTDAPGSTQASNPEWQRNRPPPPTDLVISLRRLLV
jgi:hypothetical protein